MIKLLKTKIVQVLLVTVVLSGIGFFAHKATSKENHQTNTMYVAEGGTGYLVPQQEEKKNGRLDISYHPGVEYSVENGMTYKFGATIKW